MKFDLARAMNLPTHLCEEHLEVLDETPSPFRSPNIEARDPIAPQEERIGIDTFPLHPQLDPSAAQLLQSLLQSTSSTAGIFELSDSSAHARVHVLMEGRLRLIALEMGAEPTEIGQCDSGQWIGLPNALREYDDSAHEMRRPTGRVTIEAIPVGRVRTCSMLVSELVEAMRSNPSLSRCIRRIVAIRFARRDQILARFNQNPIIRRLTPAKQEYLLQIGMVRRRHRDQGSALYLAAGRPSGRVALLLDGECNMSLQDGGSVFVGDRNAPIFIGQEALMSAVEQQTEKLTLNAVEAPRSTNVFIAAGSEILEFTWASFRWTIARSAAVWQSIARKLKLGQSGSVRPEIVLIQSSSRELDLSTLTTGAATALDQFHGRKICIVDLHGAHRFQTFYASRGFSFELKTFTFDLVSQDRPIGNSVNTLEYCRLLPPPQNATTFQWSPTIEVVWPHHEGSAQDAEHIVDMLVQRDDLDMILVCAQSDRNNPECPASEIAARFNFRSRTVLYVTDKPELGYHLDAFAPSRLVWIERMNRNYLQQEEERKRQAINQTRSHDYMQLIPTLRRKVTPDAAIAGEERDSSSYVFRRQVVRVPDDENGIQVHDHNGPLDLLQRGGRYFPLVRAFARLARVITRQTVGLALGGGGAWAYSHIALIQHLEKQGIPIDYIAGSSFGATIGGLYAAGGLPALERLIEENSLDSDSFATTILSPFTSPLTRTSMLAPISTRFIEWFVDGQLKRMGINHGRAIGLGTTEIPFYPIGSDLISQREITNEHTTIGLGVRMSSTMPPFAPAIEENGQRIVDGAFVAIVPTRFLRELGADFIIASLTVPPTPREIGSSSVFGHLARIFGTRFHDALWANQLLTWQADKVKPASTQTIL